MFEETQVSRQLRDFGIKATKLYCIALIGGIPLLARTGAIVISPIRVNELGDFLAGAFGPLAIFWLVLGFFQQGEELRHSTEALKLQAQELQNSVDQQRQLVEVSREQLRNEMDQHKLREIERVNRIQPDFVVQCKMNVGRGGDVGKYSIELSNAGNSASQIKCRVTNSESSICVFDVPAIGRDHHETKQVSGGNYVPAMKSEIHVEIRYTDNDGTNWCGTYLLTPVDPTVDYPTFAFRKVGLDRLP